MAHRVAADYTDLAGSVNVKVFVRARPFEDVSGSAEFLSVDPEQSTKLTIKDPEGGNKKKYSEVTFQFDNVFWTDTKQEGLFESVVQPQVDHVLNCYNCCCFACTWASQPACAHTGAYSPPPPSSLTCPHLNSQTDKQAVVSPTACLVRTQRCEA